MVSLSLLLAPPNSISPRAAAYSLLLCLSFPRSQFVLYWINSIKVINIHSLVISSSSTVTPTTIISNIPHWWVARTHDTLSLDGPLLLIEISFLGSSSLRHHYNAMRSPMEIMFWWNIWCGDQSSRRNSVSTINGRVTDNLLSPLPCSATSHRV